MRSIRAGDSSDTTRSKGCSSISASGRIIVSNDSDFGVGGVTNTSPPYRLRAKTSPATGRRDRGEVLIVDTTRLPAHVSSATVRLDVVGAPPGHD